MWLSNSKKYAMDRFLEERASGGSVHQVVRHGTDPERRVKIQILLKYCTHPVQLGSAVTRIGKEKRKLSYVPNQSQLDWHECHLLSN